MSQAVASHTTPVVRLARAASEPVKQPRLFRHYRRNSPDITYLPLERSHRENAAKAAEAPQFDRTDLLTEVICTMMLAMPEDARTEAVKLASERAREHGRHSAAERARQMFSKAARSKS